MLAAAPERGLWSPAASFQGLFSVLKTGVQGLRAEKSLAVLEVCLTVGTLFSWPDLIPHLLRIMVKVIWSLLRFFGFLLWDLVYQGPAGEMGWGVSLGSVCPCHSPGEAKWRRRFSATPWCFPEQGRGLLPAVGEQSHGWVVVQAVTLGPPCSLVAAGGVRERRH